MRMGVGGRPAPHDPVGVAPEKYAILVKLAGGVLTVGDEGKRLEEVFKPALEKGLTVYGALFYRSGV